MEFISFPFHMVMNPNAFEIWNIFFCLLLIVLYVNSYTRWRSSPHHIDFQSHSIYHCLLFYLLLHYDKYVILYSFFIICSWCISSGVVLCILSDDDHGL